MSEYNEKLNLRKEKRLPLVITLRVSGKSNRGLDVEGNVRTVNVSKSGICFQSETALPIQAGDSLTGTFFGLNFKTSFKMDVKWHHGNKYGGYIGNSVEKWFIAF